ncbi:hypothetical protein [Geodermatophilus sp. SYSU D00700]
MSADETAQQPPPPKDLGPDGLRLWTAITAEYDLDEHELALLRQAARVADLCADLHGIESQQGLIVDGRINPATVELRQQRIVLTRLIVALRVPLGEDGEAAPDGTRSQYRGTRGVYQPRGLRAVDGGAS